MAVFDFSESTKPSGIKEVSGVGFYTFQLDGKPEGVCASFRIPGLKRFLGLYMHTIWWMHPSYGSTESEVMPETQLLLCRLEDKRYLILLPLVHDEVRAVLRGNKASGELELFFDGTLETEPQKTGTLLAAAAGNDPYDLMRQVLTAARDVLGTFELRENKKRPGFLDQFGWCTWDAFYHKVSEEKIFAGLESFRQAGITPGFMILDDGWQDISRDKHPRLLSFDAVREKFPNGIGGTVRTAKEKYGIKTFGIWHAYEGYWWGVIPSERLPYKTVENARLTGGMCEDGVTPKHDHYCYIDPEDAERFFDDYHTVLEQQGVDMIKVDNQGSFSAHFVKNKLPRGKAMRAYQFGLQKSASKHFRNQLINCMSNVSDVFFNMKESNLWRNSDDYFPKRPLKDQHLHLHCNAKSSFLSSLFCWPDYDMFQSYNLGGAIHAAARAVSGGPVYVCDVPEQHNFEMIRRFLDNNGVLLRPDRPAIPSEDCLLIDVQNDHLPLKLTNVCGEAGLLAVFNCCDLEPEQIHAEYGPSDIRGLKGDEFAVYSPIRGTATRLKRTERAAVKLGTEECDLLTVAPLENGFAAIGAEGKYIPPAIFGSVRHENDALICRVRCGGEILFYAETRPSQVLIDGKAHEFRFEGNLVRIEKEGPEAFEAILEK